MKKTFYLFLLMFCFLSLGACSDFLNETQTTDLDRETVFSDSTYTSGFLSDIYIDVGFDVKPNRYTQWLTGHGGLQTACDEAEFKASSSTTTDVLFATGTINSISASSDAWEKCYKKIRAVNVFLKYVDKSPMAESTKISYKAEARFLRAWYYSILLRHYGGIPLLGDDVLDENDKMKTTRDTYSDCVEYICSESNAAAKILPNRRSGKENGRISAGICKSLISRVRLTAASKLFNGSDFVSDPTVKELVGYAEYSKERWKVAADAARDVIALQTYKLFERHMDQNGKAERGWGYYAQFLAADYYSMTDYEGETFPNGAYSGVIFSEHLRKGNHYHSAFTPPSCGGNGHGGYIYHDLVECFPMIDGKPVGDGKYKYNVLKPNENRDPRFMNTVVYDGSILKSGGDANHLVSTVIGDGETQDAIYKGSPTGYYMRKLCHRDAAANWFVEPPADQPLMRYAEVLLNYAEAINEYYGANYTETLGDKVMSPYVALKAIRKRVGIEAGEDGMYGLQANMSDEQMREAIRLERRIELALEGHRFFDVRRWMIADVTDNKTMHGLEITRSLNGSKTSRIVNVRKHVFRPAMYFFPIPYSETSKSEGLIQNPYYE